MPDNKLLDAVKEFMTAHKKFWNMESDTPPDWQKVEAVIARADMTDRYNGTACPNCGSRNIGGSGIDPQDGPRLAYDRSCDCKSCNATWFEELTVTDYDGLVLWEDK